MIVKERKKSLSLLVMEFLSRRMILTGIFLDYLRYLQKGYASELIFDKLTIALNQNILIFNDLLLQPRLSNAFQWDVVILIGKVFLLYEIKSAGGEYRYGPETFMRKTGFEMKNPLIQMQENKNNFKLFLRELGYDKEFQIEAYSVFMDPTFTLYNLPDNVPILLHSQLKGHFEKISRHVPPLTRFHRKVMEDLLAHQGKPKVFWDNVPKFSFDKLQKGVCCEKCDAYGLQYSKLFAVCPHCDTTHQIRTLIEGLIDEYRTLFPGEKITSQKIHQWCDGDFPIRRIKRVMNDYLVEK